MSKHIALASIPKCHAGCQNFRCIVYVTLDGFYVIRRIVVRENGMVSVSLNSHKVVIVFSIMVLKVTPVEATISLFCHV